jgi:hypothetical protein
MKKSSPVLKIMNHGELVPHKAYAYNPSTCEFVCVFAKEPRQLKGEEKEQEQAEHFNMCINTCSFLLSASLVLEAHEFSDFDEQDIECMYWAWLHSVYIGRPESNLGKHIV